MRPVVFNGKFYGTGLNGVHRVADRLIREVDRLFAGMAGGTAPPASLIVPADADWVPDLASIRVLREPGPCSQIWEQAILPRRAAGAVLVNLCNLAPIFHRRKILLLHDVQFLFPDSSYPARRLWGLRLLTPLMARTSAQVLTVSDSSRQLMALTRVSSRDRTAVLHNGTDHLADAPAAITGAAGTSLRPGRYAVVFGTAAAYKNVQRVFDAFADPRLAGLALVVIGSGAAELKAAGLRPPPSARFVGRIADETLRGLYADALCLAFPSRTEGFGLPPLEAAMCGCPSVVAPAGAIPEICGDAVLYAGVDAADEWVEAIARYAADPALRAAKIAAARARAARFRWADAGRGLLEHILRLAA